MKVLVYGINFAPEPLGVGRYTGEMVAALQAAGHEVRVVTALPYYPEWKVAQGYRRWAYAFEQWQGVPVARAPLWVPFRPGGRKRVLHLLSFAVSSLPLLLRQLFWRPDVVWMAAPAFVCAPATLVAARLCGAKAWLHVQDWEIDIAFGMGLISGSRWRAMVLAGERWLLRRFDHVSTISQAMLGRALQKGVPAERTSLVPNWAPVQGAPLPLAAGQAYRELLGLPPGAVVALYSGSMGVKQGVDWLADAALRLEGHPSLHFVFCGDGALRAQAQARCSALPNVHFLPLQPLERLQELLALADVHLLPQRQDAAGLVMPSKLTGMLASGRPVLAMAEYDSELADVVAPCGVVVPHGDVEAFAHALQYLAERPALRERLGQHAHAWAREHIAQEAVLGRLERQLQALGGGPALLGDEVQAKGKT